MTRWAVTALATVAAAVLAACASPTDQDVGSGRPVASATAGASDPVSAPDGDLLGTGVLTAEPPAPSPTASAPAGGFVWEISTVTAADLPHSWRDGCPVPPDDLRAVRVSHHDFDGAVRTGVLVVNADVVGRAERAFRALFDQRFPIRSIRPVDEFGGSDDESMAADNTSAFNCRAAVNDSGSTSWSRHAYGRAIDVNPVENPYVLSGRVLPPTGVEFTDRTQERPGMLLQGSPALQAFLDAGFTWGGVWSNPDYQHLQR